MYTVLVTTGIPMDGIGENPNVRIQYPGEGKVFSREELLALLPKADAVLGWTPLDREMIQAGKNLKLIACYGAGYDFIDMDAATSLKIPVVNIPDTVTEATAELAITLMLSLSRRICELNQLMHQPNNATAFGIGKRMGISLRGATLGIVGMGRIGSRVAEFGRFAGMRVVYSARSPKPEQNALGAIHLPLEALMQEADFVSLHVPYTKETDRLISRELLFSMKPTGFFINTARGLVVDEDALLALLQEKRIAGAALDVFAGEPHIRPEFATLPNALLTPHAGTNTIQTRRHMIMTAWERIMDVLEGRRPQNLLNPQVWKDA